MKKIIIGVIDCSKYDNYAKWIANDPDVEAVKLSYKENNFTDIEKCHGILLTGGEDVHPKFYGKPEYLPLCHQDDVDEKRDEFEWKVLEYTEAKKLPVLGICRGLQVANVYFGGSLIPDIPSFGKHDHSKIQGKDRYHEVKTDANSLLRKITGHEKGEVNSAHHQSADRLGKGLVVSAFSDDGIVEGLERQHPEGRPYLLLVQWHPERMVDQESAFTKKIKNNFLDNVKNN